MWWPPRWGKLGIALVFFEAFAFSDVLEPSFVMFLAPSLSAGPNARSNRAALQAGHNRSLCDTTGNVAAGTVCFKPQTVHEMGII